MAEAARRLADEVAGRFGPAAAAGGALAGAVFLSEVVAEVVLEGVGRLARAVPPPAAALLGLVLAAAVGLVAAAAGCDAGTYRSGGWQNKEGKQMGKNMKNGNGRAGKVAQAAFK